MFFVKFRAFNRARTIYIEISEEILVFLSYQLIYIFNHLIINPICIILFIFFRPPIHQFILSLIYLSFYLSLYLSIDRSMYIHKDWFMKWCFYLLIRYLPIYPFISQSIYLSVFFTFQTKISSRFYKKFQKTCIFWIEGIKEKVTK